MSKHRKASRQRDRRRAIEESLAVIEMEVHEAPYERVYDDLDWDAIYGEWFIDEYTGSDVAL